MTWLALTPFAAPPGAVLQRVGLALGRTFGLSIRLTPPLPEPQHALDGARGQWAATEFLKAALAQGAPDAGWLLGITERDLFVPVLSFVYGQAQLKGRAAVVSLARLRPEFYALPADEDLLSARAEKEAVHEVGHLLGLVHCLDRVCPMSLSIGVQDLDFKSAEPCRSCSALLAGGLPMMRARSKTSNSSGGER